MFVLGRVVEGRRDLLRTVRTQMGTEDSDIIQILVAAEVHFIINRVSEWVSCVEFNLHEFIRPDIRTQTIIQLDSPHSSHMYTNICYDVALNIRNGTLQFIALRWRSGEYFAE